MDDLLHDIGMLFMELDHDISDFGDMTTSQKKVYDMVRNMFSDEVLENVVEDIDEDYDISRCNTSTIYLRTDDHQYVVTTSKRRMKVSLILQEIASDLASTDLVEVWEGDKVLVEKWTVCQGDCLYSGCWETYSDLMTIHGVLLTFRGNITDENICISPKKALCGMCSFGDIDMIDGDDDTDELFRDDSFALFNAWTGKDVYDMESIPTFEPFCLRDYSWDDFETIQDLPVVTDEGYRLNGMALCRIIEELGIIPEDESEPEVIETDVIDTESESDDSET